MCDETWNETEAVPLSRPEDANTCTVYWVLGTRPTTEKYVFPTARDEDEGTMLQMIVTGSERDRLRKFKSS